MSVTCHFLDLVSWACSCIVFRPQHQFFKSVLCAKGRLQVVFTITARDIYIPVIVQEVIKFEPAPVIRPNFGGPIGDRFNGVPLYWELFTVPKLVRCLYIRIIDQSDQARSPVKMAGYYIAGQVLFCVLMDGDGVEVNKNAKKERGKLPAVLTNRRNVSLLNASF